MQVGVDIIEIERLKELSLDDKKLKKLFTANEINYFNKFTKKEQHVAGFFCAKEAFSKALKCGFGKVLSPLDIEVLHEESGAPYINIINTKIKTKLNGKKIDVNISHSNTMATAVCIIF